MPADDWTEKYRPQTLKEIVGNPTSAETMHQWALSWEKGTPKFRALVLIGTPGIGKTSSAEALAREMGWGLVEMNASDQRTGGAIQDIATRASNFNTFDADGSYMSASNGGRKLIILDEADSLYGNSDRGAMPVIVDLIRNTRQPVILICNDFYELSRRSSAIKSETMQITFRKPQAASIAKVLMKICAKERVIIAPEAIQTIAENAGGDLRAAVRDLQSIALGRREVTAEMAEHISQRESRSDMFEFIHMLLKKRNAPAAKQLLRECDVDPGTVSVWIDENLPKNCASRQDLCDAYNALSRADVYLGRVGKRMYYGLWSYANDMMVYGITDGLRTPTMSFERVSFPTYLSKMSRSRTTRALRKSVAMKLGMLIHTSANTILSESMDFFRAMAVDDADFRVILVKDAMLEPDELGFLMGCKTDDKRIKAAMLAAHPPEPKEPKTRTTRAKKTQAAPAEPKAPVKKEVPAAVVEAPIVQEPAPAPPASDSPPPADPPAAPKSRQKSLFDF
ncbi:MAG: replication factor C large subunit [archaeon]|nr:replication factor C large subunit [archaeon]